MKSLDLDRIIQAAAQWHAGQTRDGEKPLPYITHPIEVLAVLRHVGGVTDGDSLAAAVLHDVLEETSATPEQIESLAGPRVRELVVHLTRREPTESETRGMSKSEIWTLRSRILLDEIARMPPHVQVIKLADRLSNLREAKHAKQGEKLERYVRQSGLILEIVPRRVNPGLWDAVKREL